MKEQYWIIREWDQDLIPFGPYKTESTRDHMLERFESQPGKRDIFHPFNSFSDDPRIVLLEFTDYGQIYRDPN
jgi:hypothetical protein